MLICLPTCFVQACPISPGEVASQSCFDEHPLQFVADNLYGAVPDPNFPERAYLPPVNFNGLVYDSSGVHGSKYSHRFRLPQGLFGSNVLIQWHYITANGVSSNRINVACESSLFL